MFSSKHLTLATLPICGVILASACSSTSEQASPEEEKDDYAVVNMKTDSDEENLSADQSARYSVADDSQDERPSAEQSDVSGYNNDRTSSTEQQEQPLQPMSMTFYFDFDSSDLEDENADRLESLEVPSDQTLTISVEGHADAQGPEEYNQQLSQARAEEVKQEIADTLDTTQIEWEVQGHGESEPASSNDSEWGRQRNRRVEVTIDQADSSRDRVGARME